MDDLDLIKQKVNIVDLVGEYVTLKKAGVNYKAPCPFHQEKSPSFVVSPERGIWHCFGCGKGGDQFKFLMEKEGVDFPEAIEILAKRAGITLNRKKNPEKNKKQRLYELNEKAAEFFHFLLTTHKLGAPALEYVQKRGLTDETIKTFQIGYAPNSWQSLTDFLQKRGFSLQEMIDSGLVVPSKNRGYDRYRGRIMFPLTDVRGQIIGFSGRILGVGEPKYINNPQTEIFDKSLFLFGIQQAKGEIKQKNAAIIVEGEMDMLMSYQSGVKNIVASKGTALTEGQIDLARKYTDTVLLCFDKDLAGDGASRRGIEMADRKGLQIKVIQIPDGKDPAETCLKDVELWKEAVDKAESIYDYYLQSVSVRYNPRTAEGKRRIGQELIPIWAKITDPLTFEHYLQKLSALLAVDEAILRREIKRNGEATIPTFKTIFDAPTRSQAQVRSRHEVLEEYLMALLLKIPPALTFVPKYPETIFITEKLRALYVLLVLYLDSISFKSQAFSISGFVKNIPEELIEEVDRLYLIEIDDKLIGPKTWEEEVEKVYAELKRVLIKASLEKLSSQIKTAESFGKIDQLEVLNKRFRDLSQKLKNL
jgi:DNA primase